MDEIKAKQQVIEKIKESKKILVTVSDSPSVDALSAALALTLIFDKQEKYATAIFSGETPPAIAFLEPQKTFDDTTDSLRDFIIALNKEKADHLRYKVEGDSVKIFITPYKTTIDQSDLEFSQGDYNVELVIALGVTDQNHLDKALENHGQILHDAAIVTVTAGEQSSDLGGIDWHDAGASSLSEMIAGLAEAMKVDKKKSLIDTPIATALLTGVVAQTDRFSNQHTTSKAMTVAANLMSAGADQQLIANELQASQEIQSAPAQPEEQPDDSDVDIDNGSDDGSMTINQPQDQPQDSSSLDIDHDGETLADLDRRVLGDEKAKEKVTEEVEAIQEAAAAEENAQETAEHEAYAPQEVSEPEPPVNEQSEEFTPDGMPDFIATPHEAPAATTNAYAAEDDDVEPILGGTLNATTEQAADDARRIAESDQNKTILSHAYIGGDQPSADQSTGFGFPGTPPPVPGSVGVNSVVADEASASAYAPEMPAPVVPDAAPLGISGERVLQPLSTPEPAPVDLGLPLPPPIPDFSQPSAAPAIPLPVAPQPAILGDILAPEPGPAPIDFTANAVPAPNTAYAQEDVATLPPIVEQPAPQQPQQGPSDPTQFQIPPQQ